LLDEFVGSLDSQVPHPTFEGVDTETNNEFVDRSNGQRSAPERPKLALRAWPPVSWETL
jgi:hypothetical protein